MSPTTASWRAASHIACKYDCSATRLASVLAAPHPGGRILGEAALLAIKGGVLFVEGVNRCSDDDPAFLRELKNLASTASVVVFDSDPAKTSGQPWPNVVTIQLTKRNPSSRLQLWKEATKAGIETGR